MVTPKIAFFFHNVFMSWTHFFRDNYQYLSLQAKQTHLYFILAMRGFEPSFPYLHIDMSFFAYKGFHYVHLSKNVSRTFFESVSLVPKADDLPFEQIFKTYEKWISTHAFRHLCKTTRMRTWLVSIKVDNRCSSILQLLLHRQWLTGNVFPKFPFTHSISY